MNNPAPQPGPPRLRRATATDVPALCRICRESFPFTLRWAAGSGMARAWWRSAVGSRSCEAWVLSDAGDHPRGFALLVTDERAWSAERPARRGSLVARLAAIAACPRLAWRERRPARPLDAEGRPISPGAGPASRTWLELIAIARASRGTGGADALLARCEERTSDLRRTELRLRVERSNVAACRFYAKHGYLEAGESGGAAVLYKPLPATPSDLHTATTRLPVAGGSSAR